MSILHNRRTPSNIYDRIMNKRLDIYIHNEHVFIMYKDTL